MDVSTPVKSTGKPSALKNALQSPITERYTATSTPTMIKRVTFDVVDTPDSLFGRAPQYKATPFLSRTAIKTPSGVMCSQNTPQSNHKRGKTSPSSPDDLLSTRKDPRVSSVLTPRNSVFNTPSGFMNAALDFSCDEVFSTPAKIRRSSPPKMRLSDNDHSVSIYLFIYQLFWTQACYAQRKYARTGLKSHARCHPYPIPQPVKVGHTTGVYHPYSFRIVMWVLLRPTWTNRAQS